MRAFYGKAMEDADTSCSTRKGWSPHGNVYLPRQRCTVNGTCGPTAQRLQKQHSEAGGHPAARFGSNTSEIPVYFIVQPGVHPLQGNNVESKHTQF